jgi:hypothetical protein
MMEGVYDWLTTVAGYVLAAVMGLYTVYRNRVTDKRLKESEESKKKAEARLAEMEARGKGPYFIPSQAMLSYVYDQEDDNVSMFMGFSNQVLSTTNRVVKELKAGEPVLLLLENAGAPARGIRMKTALPGAVLKEEPDMDDAHGAIFLKYEYDPTQQGKTVEIELKFESMDGYQGTHIYETRHGEFHFLRVHPN